MAQLSLAFIAVLAATASGAVLQVPLVEGDANVATAGSGDFSQLKAIFGERLFKAHPLGKPCYSNPDARNETVCAVVNLNKTLDTFVSDQPGGYYYGNWASCQAETQEMQNCALPFANKTVDSTRKCYQGTVPDHMIAVKNPEDVEKIFKLAVKNQTPPLVIKNTGHDWKGRSAAPGSLALWTRTWKNDMELHNDFTPEDCLKKPGSEPEKVVSFGPAANWSDVYQFAHNHSLTVVGGTCPSVGVAGWLHGGGHSPLTPVYGMGVDNVRQVEIVTPDGEKRIANRCINDDLFFAVRGGGGGTWGVVTRIWYKAWDQFKVIEFSAHLGSRTLEQKRNFTQIVTSHALGWSTQGWGGYFKPTELNDTIEMVNSYKGIEKDVAEAQMEPLIRFLNASNITYVFKARDSWYEYINAHMAPPAHHPASWSLVPASRLLPPKLFEEPIGLACNLSTLYNQNITLWLMMVTPTMFEQTLKSPLHPSWGSAIMSARANTKWDLYEDGNSHAQLKRMNDSFDIVRQLAPGSGVSMSEAHIWEPQHHLAFWGQENYDKLVGIKRKFDPGNMLSVWHGINYEAEDSRFKCYPPK